MSFMQLKQQRGFTIVELLIVIVVIAILALISIVAYNGMQQRSRDSIRKQDITALEKALELYYIDKNEYPPTGTSCSISGYNGWATTADKDGCWVTFINYLKPYLNDVNIIDPSAHSVSTTTELYNSTNYRITTYYCGRQTYIIRYNTEIQASNSTPVNGSANGCSAVPAQYPSNTRYIVIHSKV